MACCFSPWDFLLHGLRRTGDGVFEVCVVCRLWALGGLPRCTVELHAVRARGCLFRGFVCLGVFEICCQVCLDQFVSDPDRSDVNGQWEFATLHTTVHQIRLKQKVPSTQEYKRPTMSKTSWHNSICKFYFVSSRETHTVWGFLRFLATWDCLPHLTPIECIGQPGHEQSAAQCRSHDGLTKTAQWFYFHFRFKPNQIYWIIYLQQRYCSKSNEELKGYQYVSPPTRFVSICSMHSHKLVACKRYPIHCDYNILMTVITISAGAPLDSSPNSGKDSGNQSFAIKVVLVSPWFALFFWSWAKTLTKPARTSILSTSFGPANEDTKTKWPKAFLFLQICFMKTSGNIFRALNQS